MNYLLHDCGDIAQCRLS